MNNISVIGTGYVGLVTGICLAEFGLNVICMDIDNQKIEDLKSGIIPIYEPGLEELLLKNYKAGRLTFTTDMKETVQKSQTLFIAVGTPPRDDGSADLQYVTAVAKEIARNMDEYKVIVNKSTVPVGTGKVIRQSVLQELLSRAAKIEFDVVSNPEFLREGSAVRDFMHPDRIIIGTESEKAREIMQSVYRVLYLNSHPFVFTNIETAELIKYASNAFLATKISFINEISALCEVVGANVQQVAKGMGLDGRIGKYYLHAGPGYGGSCFPKDTKALVKIGQQHNVKMTIVDSVIRANEVQKTRSSNKILENMKVVNGKTITILGLAFKPETDDMRDAPATYIIKILIEKGANIRVFDPVSMENAKKNSFENMKIYYASDEYDAVKNSDAVVIVTEWNQFRSLDIERIKKLMNGDYFFDFRNIYERESVEGFGFKYFGIGR